MTFVSEQIEKHAECSCCGKKLQVGDGCIIYEHSNLKLALGSCCAFYVLSSLIQDAEMAAKSNLSEIWMYSIKGENGEKLRRVAAAANGLAKALNNWAEIENDYGQK